MTRDISRSNEPDFKLGDWWARPQINELERGEESVHVEARSMAVLVCLARYAPGTVSKQRLLTEAWCDSAFVGDEVISHAIWELRRALGDSAREPKYIQTIPRKGYRLLTEVLRPQGSPLPMEGVRIDHYDIQREVGRGSMGVVFEATDRRLGRTVALKFLSPDQVRDIRACQRFEREARLAASLDHPNLATVLEVGETSQGHRYLAMAYYRGGSLKELLAQGSLPVEVALPIARQIAAGLSAAHQRDIVHRDIKPANLLLDEHGTLKIADFGIAKLLGSTDLTNTGASLGTPAYKSPEQNHGNEVDHRTDIWSLGVVLFEMLVGRRPFEGEPEALADARLADARGELVPDELRRILTKGMAKKPSERYQNSTDLLDDLDRLADEKPQVKNLADTEPEIVPEPQRHRVIKIAILLFALLVLAVALLTRIDEPSKPSRNPKADESLASAKRLWLRGDDPSNLDRVEEHLYTAVDLAPNWAEALGHLAVFKADRFASQRKESDLLEARRLIDTAMDLDPPPYLAHLAEARLFLLDRSRLGEAKEFAHKALAAQPHCKAPESCDLTYVWLGEILWVQGRRDEAMRILEQGIEQGEGLIRCRLKRAQLFRQSGETTKAMLDYEYVVDLDPNQTTALNGLGVLYLTTNQYEKAAPLFASLYRLNSEPSAKLNLGNAYYGQNRWQDALAAFEEAHQSYDLRGDLVSTAAVGAGDVFLEMGDQEQAKVWFNRALDIFEQLTQRPNPAVKRLAQQAVCKAKVGRLEEAEKEIQDLLQRRDDYADLLGFAARIYALKGDDKKLFALAQQAVEAGVPPHQLTADAAFKPYRNNNTYLRVISKPLELTK